MILTTRPGSLRLTLTMLALCAQFAVAADGPAPAPVPVDRTDWSAVDKVRGEREARAEAMYVKGVKAREDARLNEAVQAFTLAVDFSPESEKYQKALAESRALANLSRDTRSVAIDRRADELNVRQQQLWAEAQSRIDEGAAAMNAGDYSGAERLFQMAAVRLESLPYADERTAPEMRRAEALAQEAQKRRAVSDQQAAAAQNQQAAERKADLRDLSLKLERDRIDAMLKRAVRARERRDYDEAILLCEQVLKINRAEERASSLLVKCRRERHSYLRQITADRWDEEHKLLSENIRRAMLPQLELIRYSAEWPEIDARRSAPVRGLEEENETWRKTITDQLEQEVTLDFQDNDLADVVQFLQRITSVNIVLDPRVIANSPPPVTLRVDKMKLRFVLDFIMRITSLKYALRDEAIYISNEQGVRGDQFMKLYDVRDLTHAMQSFPGPDLDIPEPGGTGSRLLPPVEPESRPETSEFIAIIKSVVAPNTWSDNGGQGTIEEFNGSMVVTQTKDIHEQVAEMLRSLRNQKGTQIHVKVKFLAVENASLEEIGVNWNNFTGPTAPGTASLVPLPAQRPGSSVGGYYADPANSMVAAGAVDNQLQSYTTGNSLSRSPGDGFQLGGQSWQIANNLYASAVLDMVEKERKGNVLFEPDLSMFNGQQAHIVNMNQQSYIADYDVVQGQYDPIVSILSYGTVLDVQAIASADKKYITLTLRPTDAQVESWRRFGPPVTTGTFPGGPVVGGQAGNAAAGNGGTGGPSIAGTNPLLIPQLLYRSVRTSVTIPDGGSLVIAGMTKGESGQAHSGIPFLSHIPFLGRLFSRNGRQETELRNMIVVQADVVIFEEVEKNL